MAPIEVKVEGNGRILLPVDVRRQLGVKPGDVLLLELSDEGVRLWTRAMAARELQALAPRIDLSEGPPGVELEKLRRVSGPPANTEVGKNRRDARAAVAKVEEALVRSPFDFDDDDDE